MFIEKRFSRIETRGTGTNLCSALATIPQLFGHSLCVEILFEKSSFFDDACEMQTEDVLQCREKLGEFLPLAASSARLESRIGS